MLLYHIAQMCFDENEYCSKTYFLEDILEDNQT